MNTVASAILPACGWWISSKKHVTRPSLACSKGGVPRLEWVAAPRANDKTNTRAAAGPKVVYVDRLVWNFVQDPSARCFGEFDEQPAMGNARIAKSPSCHCVQIVSSIVGRAARTEQQCEWLFNRDTGSAPTPVPPAAQPRHPDHCRDTAMEPRPLAWS